MPYFHNGRRLLQSCNLLNQKEKKYLALRFQFSSTYEMHDCGIFPHLLSNFDIEKRLIYLYLTSKF